MPINDNADKSFTAVYARSVLSESAESIIRYLVVDFGDGFRVIECVAGIQWIVQRRVGAVSGGQRSVLLSYARGAVALFRPPRSSGTLLARSGMWFRRPLARPRAPAGGNTRAFYAEEGFHQAYSVLPRRPRPPSPLRSRPRPRGRRCPSECRGRTGVRVATIRVSHISSGTDSSSCQLRAREVSSTASQNSRRSAMVRITRVQMMVMVFPLVPDRPFWPV